jgi:hypothetical protein
MVASTQDVDFPKGILTVPVKADKEIPAGVCAHTASKMSLLVFWTLS